MRPANLSRKSPYGPIHQEKVPMVVVPKPTKCRWFPKCGDGFPNHSYPLVVHEPLYHGFSGGLIGKVQMKHNSTVISILAMR
uniref:Uncharacterized protein n=1 Tax=Picea glauca TaxID=3330 RepID=A0A101M043_PICGL|nr:hypothetical protein ABT39_MTgene4601 [Picea glauca]